MIINTYDAKTNLSKLLEKVQAGETVTIANAGKPVADLVPHQPIKKPLQFGTSASKIQYDITDFEGIDSDIQKMFYGTDES